MENKLTIKDGSIAFISGLVLCQIGTAIFAAICLSFATFFGISNEMFFTFLDTAFGILLTSLFMDGIIVLIFFFFNKNKDNKILSKPTFKKVLIYILLAVLLYLLLYPIVTVFNNIICKFFPKSDFKYKLTTTNYFISLVSMVILPAIAEELLFRGLIFKGLQKHSNIFAIIMSSIMFSLFHLSLEQTIYPILMGLVLAVIMCYENNIIYCITIHFVNNFTTLTLKFFDINLVFKSWSYYLLAFICAAIFITLLIYAFRKLKNKKQKIESEHKAYLTICLGVVLLIWIIVQLSVIFKGL